MTSQSRGRITVLQLSSFGGFHMPAWLAVLISGVLLNPMDVPRPKYYLAFTSSEGKWIEVTTDKDGKFQVDLAPGTYRYWVGLRRETITVDETTSELKLKLPALPERTPDGIEIIRPSQIPDYSLRLGPRV